MNTGILSPKVNHGKICNICGTTYDKCDMGKHLRVFLTEYGKTIQIKKEKAIIWKNRKGPEPIRTRLPHNELLKTFRIKEDTLPPLIKVQILGLEIDKASIDSQAQKEKIASESAGIASLINRFIAKEPLTSPYINNFILAAGRRLFDLSINPDTEPSFLQALIRPYGLIFRARELSPYINNSPIEREEYRHCIDLTEKSAADRLDTIRGAKAAEPEIKKPFVSSSEEKLKREYQALLEKNIEPVAAFIKGEKEKMRQSIESFLRLNTTSVFQYTYDQDSEELTGKVGEMAIKKISLKK